MELDVQRAVDPGEPDQAEDDGELDSTANRDVLRELMRRLADDGHVNEVIEQLEEAHSAVETNGAMRAWRPREPLLERAIPLTGHGLSLLSHW
jgi:hypothetical protein